MATGRWSARSPRSEPSQPRCSSCGAVSAATAHRSLPRRRNSGVRHENETVTNNPRNRSHATISRLTTVSDTVTELSQRPEVAGDQLDRVAGGVADVERAGAPLPLLLLLELDAVGREPL